MAAAISNGGAAQSPNQTLYVSNLNDKLSKPDLRRALYMLFSTFGPVLDVVALKTAKMRGQAHVVFRDVGTCNMAMREMQDTDFFGKPMKLSYGKGKSRIISRLDGSAMLSQENARKERETQQPKSIFAAPPPSSATAQAGKSGGELRPAPQPAAANAPSPRKRPRKEEEEEEEDEGGEAMDESDGDAMDESD